MRAESSDITTDLILIQTPSRLWRLGWSTNVGWDSEDTRLCGTAATSSDNRQSLWMISASGFFGGWTTWTTGWASKNEDLLPRYLVLSISNNTKANLMVLYSTHPYLFNAKPDLIVDHHDHSLCSPASSFLVYPRRKLFSSWKVCKCKTASLSDRGGTSLKRGNTHKHKHKDANLNSE